MKIDRIAILVHPLWSSRDLGQGIVDFWKKNIELFTQDKRFALVMTGCPTDYCYSNEWKQRVLPIIGQLPENFGQRFLRWPENYVFANNPNHVKILKEKFNLPEVKFSERGYPINSMFEEARVDGLIPGSQYCVAEQCRQIKPICKGFNVSYWNRN